MMLPKKIVIPVQSGIKPECTMLKFLDSSLRGNDG